MAISPRGVVTVESPGKPGPPGKAGVGLPGERGLPGQSTQQFVAEGAIGLAKVCRTTDASQKMQVATTDLRSKPFHSIAVAAVGSGEMGDFHVAGPIPPGIFQLTPGVACAVGVDATGAIVRATDPTCVSAPNWIGTCDSEGNVTVNPRRSDYLNVLDFGADPTGTDLCDDAFDAVVAAATAGQTIFFPAGVYRYARTFKGFARGVNVQGVGSSHYVGYAGSILQYEGLADAVRFGTFFGAINGVVKDICIRNVNENNIAPQRQSPSRTIGAVIGTANFGGEVQIHTAVDHGLTTGMLVCIDSVVGTTEANGGWQCTVQDSTHFTLDGSVFAHSWVSGGRARTRCGAGLAVVLTSQFLWENVYCNGFGVGFLLDGGQNSKINSCYADGYSGNGGLGSLPKRFQCAVWITDGDSGCSGLDISGATAVDTIEGLHGNGCRIVFQIDGCVNINITKCSQSNLGQTGMKITNVTNVINSSGLMKVTTDAPHGLLTGDYAGIRDIVDQNGTNNSANGEFKVTVIDTTNFTLDGADPAGFAFPYLRNGSVNAYCPATFARIHRATILRFDGCYTEGSEGDGHFLFEKQTEAGATNLSQIVSIKGHVAAGAPPVIALYQEALSELTVSESFLVCGQGQGPTYVSGVHVRLGNYMHMGAGNLPFWAGGDAATQVQPQNLLVREIEN